MTATLVVLALVVVAGLAVLVAHHRRPQEGRHSHAGRERRLRQLRHPSAAGRRHPEE